MMDALQNGLLAKLAQNHNVHFNHNMIKGASMSIVSCHIMIMTCLCLSLVVVILIF